jgi:hypothetical protein
MQKSNIKIFNTAGTCVPSEHYMLPVLPRIPEIQSMFEGKFYFIIHAPRQSGKTTLLNALTDKINNEGRYYAINCSLASLKLVKTVDMAMTYVVSEINQSLDISNVPLIRNKAFSYDNLPNMKHPNLKAKTLLNKLCLDLDKELIVFFDEADCLSGLGLVIFLTQIRDGYLYRNSPQGKFPISIALVGMRDIRDYLIKTRSDDQTLGQASPFNVKKDALTLPNFTQEEISSLYNQHTEATGQAFSQDAVERVWHWSEGQPWLVNALANETIVTILKNDYTLPITAHLIDKSAEILIKHKHTHIDSLLERLKEPRVAKIMDVVFASSSTFLSENDDDRRYCIDLGLVVPNAQNNLRPANAIYMEVMSRFITQEIEMALLKTLDKVHWTDGKEIFLNDVLKEFQKFYRKGALSFPFHDKKLIAALYDESLYSFILESFLQRLVNSDATVTRQYAQGRGAVDIGIIYNHHEYLIEIKIKGQEKLEDSLKQLTKYLDTNGTMEGWLVIFDRDRKKKWEEKITWNTILYERKTIHVVGC